MNKSDIQLHKFDIAIKHAEFAANQLWQIFQIFILVHTILIALLGNILFGNTSGNSFYLVLISVIGLFMSIMWLGAYLRARDYYDFRLVQASRIEPDDMKLLRNYGKKFAEGKKVEINGKFYQMGILSRILRMKRTMPFLIVIFLLFYSLLISSIMFK